MLVIPQALSPNRISVFKVFENSFIISFISKINEVSILENVGSIPDTYRSSIKSND